MQSPAAELYAQDKFSEIRDALCSAAPDRPERLARDYFKGAKPCTMLIDEVEAIWAPIADEDDWSAFRAKLEEIGRLREALGFDASRFIP